jgi:hypothetical protein
MTPETVPQNNGMKLTARGASDEARQLIPVLGRHGEQGDVVGEAMKGMRIGLALLVLACTWRVGVAETKQPTAPVSVSLVQLIASPAEYDGKRVAVAGYCNLEFEGDALYLHEEDFAHQLTPNAIRLAIRPPVPASYRAAHHNYATVEGTFKAPRAGAPGFRGGLYNISRLERVPSRAEVAASGGRD